MPHTIKKIAIIISAAIEVLMIAIMPQAALADAASPVTFNAWHRTSDFILGQSDSGIKITHVSGRPALTLRAGSTLGTWTSTDFESPAPIGDLVSSWEATTPAGSWIETHLSVKVADHWSTWYVMGKWASDASTIARTSVNDQSDADGTIYTDTYVPNTDLPTAYRLQVVLHGTMSAKPLVYQLAATTSSLTGASDTTSRTTIRHAVNLPVPSYSEQIHAGEYPAYGGGGKVWCSPTSVAQVMSYWHKGPSAAELATLPADTVFDTNGRVDPEVDWTAIHTWDTAYEGAGNWPFSVAYAASYGLDASVRQYTSLQDVEYWLKKGVPVIASIAWNNTDTNPANDLTGAPIPKSAGHLVVVSGFTATGDVIATDAAAATDATTHITYQRAQFERIWLNASTGTVYLIKPTTVHG